MKRYKLMARDAGLVAGVILLLTAMTVVGVVSVAVIVYAVI